MRKHAMLLIFSTFLVALAANYVENKPTVITDPDGRKHELFITGDEYYHRVHDAAGFTILKHPRNGNAVYAVFNGRELRASDYRVGTINPVSLGIRPGLLGITESIRARFEAEQQRIRNGRYITSGFLNVLVVFVRFNDQDEFSTDFTYAHYNNMFNGIDQPSLKDYYDEVSAGQLDITAHLVPAANPSGYVVSVMIDQPRGYFSPYNEEDNTIGYTSDEQSRDRRRELIAEATAGLDAMIPNSVDVDADNDGYVDGLTLLIKDSPDAWGDLLWPTSGGYGGVQRMVNGASITNCIINFETGLGLSVLCHEQGHQIGAPDFYHYQNSTMGDHEPWASIKPVSQWCLMGSDNAQHWLTHNKFRYGGWFSQIPTLSPTASPQSVTLQSVDSSPYACYKVLTSDPNQYYMLEYRKQSGRYEVNVPSSGLIVYRVIADEVGNAGGPPDEIYVYRPGGTLTQNGDPAAAALSSEGGRTDIFTGADPSPWLWADTLSVNNGNLVITNVGSNAGNSITFSISTVGPNAWIGAVNHDWNNAGNWSSGVPTANQEIVISAGTMSQPQISVGLNVSCGKLTLNTGATLDMAGGTLTLNGTAHIRGTVRFTAASTKLDCKGSMVVYSSGMFIDTTVGQLNINGDLNIDTGAVIQLDQSSVTFYGGEDITFTNQTTVCIFRNLYIAKTNNKSVILSTSSTKPIRINAIISISGTAGFVCNYDGNVEVHGSIIGTGKIKFNSGTLFLRGTEIQTITHNTGGYFNNVRLYCTEVQPSSDLVLNGSMTIDVGTLNSGTRQISVAGDWLNNGGTYSGTNAVVVFTGSGQSYVNETAFGKVILAKTGNGSIYLTDGRQFTCAQFDWTSGAVRVSGGDYTVNEYLDFSVIYGSYYLSGGTINLHTNYGSAVFNCDLTISGGTFNVYSINEVQFALNRTINFNFTGGVFDAKTSGIILGNAPMNFSSAVGTKFRVNGDLTIYENFNQYNGDFELYGSQVSNVSSNGGSVNNLIIGKTGTTVTKLNNSLLIRNSLTVNSPLELQDRSITLTVNNNFTLNSTLSFASSGNYVSVGKNMTCSATSGTQIAVGTLEVKQNLNVASGSTFAMNGNAILKLTGTTTSVLDLDQSATNLATIDLAKTGSSVSLSSGCATGGILANALTIRAGTTFTHDRIAITVQNSLTIEHQGAYSKTTGAELITGNLYCSGLLNLTAGNLTVNGTFIEYATGVLQINGGVLMIDTPYSGYYYSFGGAVNLGGGTLQITNNGMQIGSNAFTFTGGTIKLGWGLQANTSNTFQPNAGQIVFIGERSSSIFLGSGNNLPTIDIQKTGTTGSVSLQTDVTVKLNCQITSGKLLANHHTLTVTKDMTIGTAGILYADNSNDVIIMGGKWNNQGTASNFIEGSGLVKFINSAYTKQIDSNETFHHLWIDSNTQYVFIAAGKTVNVTGNVEIDSGKFMGLEGSVLNVTGDLLIIGENSKFDYQYRRTNEPSNVHVSGDVIIDQGILVSVCTNAEIPSDLFMIDGDLTMTGGKLVTLDVNMTVHGNFTTTTSSYVEMRGGTFLNDASYTGSWQIINCPWQTYGNVIEFTNKGLQFVTGAALDNNSYTIIRLGRGLYAVTSGVLGTTSGTFEFIGTVQANINLGGDNFLPAVKISKTSASVVLSTAAIIKGDLTIQSGNFNSNNYTLTVGGSWINNVGTTGYSCGTSEVFFNLGGYSSVLNGNQTFNKITINRDAGKGLNITNSSSTVLTDLVINSGKPSIASDGTMQVNGNVTIAQDAQLSLIGNLKIKGNLTDANTSITGDKGLNASYVSTTTLNGTSTQSITVGYSEIYLGGFTLDKISGAFQPAKRINCSGNLSVQNGSWGYGIAGLIHTVQGNFTVATGSIWNDNTCTLILTGNSNASVSVSGTVNLSSITISKGAAYAVTLATNLTLNAQGYVNIDNGILDIGSRTFQTYGEIDVNADAQLRVGAGGILKMKDGGSLEVTNLGKIVLYGTSSQPATITRISGNYELMINSGGSISADWAIFEYMNADGVEIVNGATVDPAYPFNHCTFRNGVMGGCLLQINNNQNLTIQDARFPLSGGASNNVKKLTNQGIVSFTAETGDFAGSMYENDMYQRINWSSDIPMISVNPGSVNFGTLTWGQSTSNGLMIYNPGTATLHGTITTPTGYSVSAMREGDTRDQLTTSTGMSNRNILDFSIYAGWTANYWVTFNPPNPGTYNGDLIITHNASSPEVHVALSGIGVGPQLHLSDSYPGFDIVSGQSQTQTIYISNTGTDSLTYNCWVNSPTPNPENIIFVSFEDSCPPSGWSEINVSGSTGDWDRLQTAVSPIYANPSEGNWMAYFNSATASTNTKKRLQSEYFNLTNVYGTNLTFDMLHDTNSPGANDRIQLQISVGGGTWTDFGSPISRYDGRTGWYQQSYDISAYDGMSDLRIGFVGISAQGQNMYLDNVKLTSYRSLPQNWITINGASFASGEVFSYETPEPLNIGINTAGVPTGTYTAGIGFMSNDPVYPMYNLPMVIRIGSPSYYVFPSYLAFGDAPTGYPATQVIEIHNTGDIALEGTFTNVDCFVVQEHGRNRNTLSFSVNPGMTGLYDVVFTPVSAQDYSGQITIASNTGTPVYYDVSGNGISLPVVSDGTISEISATSAIYNGYVTSTGNLALTQRGIVWNTTGNPDPLSDQVILTPGQSGSFSIPLNNLSIGQNYYIKAIATNSFGTTLGNQVHFATLTPLLAVAPDSISGFGSVALGASSSPQMMTVSGINLIDTVQLSSQLGFRMSLNETSGYDTLLILQPEGQTLAPTNVYIRFSPQAVGEVHSTISPMTAGGNSPIRFLSATGITTPIVVSSIPFEVTANSVRCGGLVVDNGLADVTEIGLCWGVTSDPLISGMSIALPPAVDWFNATAENLDPGTTYFIRAFAINQAGVGYGNVNSFTTPAAPVLTTTGLPLNGFGRVRTGEASTIQSFTVEGIYLSGTVQITASTGFGIALSQRDDQRSFTDQLNLNPVSGTIVPTPIYVRFTPVSGGVFIGNLTISTPDHPNLEISLQGIGTTLPAVSSIAVASLTYNSATTGGTITADGWDIVTACGTCWGLLPNPTINEEHTSNNTLQGSFEDVLIGLQSNTTYHYRAYVTNSIGTSYGNDLSFTTPIFNLGIPTGINLSISSGQVIITWDAVDAASGYNIYSAVEPTIPIENWELIGRTITDTSFTCDLPSNYIKRFYLVRTIAE